MPGSPQRISLRPATSADLKFIRHSWFESYRKGGAAPQVAFPVYQHGEGALIDRLLSESNPLVAYTPAAPDEICGWTCRTVETCHYVYVKQAYRRLGIAKQLLQGVRAYSHETRSGRAVMAKIGAAFNPYVLAER